MNPMVENLKKSNETNPSVLRESLDFGSAFRVIPFLNYI